jgi:undecaprenyl-diphosphatase
LEIWQAVVLGLVEGMSEYLPVSSTGHVVLAEALLGLRTGEGQGTHEALDSLSIVIQGGAILAVAGLYWPRIVQMLRGMLGRDRAGLRLLANLMIAFLPAAVIGTLANDWIRSHLFHAWPVAGAMVVGGVYMIVFERLRARGVFGTPMQPGADGDIELPPGEIAGGGVEDVTPVKALFIGLMQVVSMWPGTSRSMMTITGAEAIGFRPAAAAEFSFLLGLPTLGAATLYSLYKNMKSARDSGGVAHGGHGNLFEQIGALPVVVGLLVSTAAAAVAVRFLVIFLNRHGLSVFGWYRIVVGTVLLGMIATENLKF